MTLPDYVWESNKRADGSFDLWGLYCHLHPAANHPFDGEMRHRHIPAREMLRSVEGIRPIASRQAAAIILVVARAACE